MKVLLINGSPHRDGCTATALAEVSRTLNEEGVETETLWLGKEPIPGCIACGACRKTGACFYHDLVNDCADRLTQADGLIVGSPVYYSGASGQLCSFLDRLFYSGSSRFAYKPAAAVVSCRRGGATAAFERLNQYFLMSDMPIVPSQYWNQVHGNTPDEVRRDEEGLQTMRTLARNMAWLLRSIDAGRRADIALPEKEPRLRTNFIR